MNRDRYRDVGRLYHEARARPRADRAAFLDEACAGDRTLHDEVSSLLDAHDQAGDFIENSAMLMSAEAMAHEESPARSGERVGRFELQALLGRGGMGAVYLAYDPALSRNVAVKLLHPWLTTDPAAVHRFEQEARAASSLNHPNVVTIYEIGQTETGGFIAMEYVDGEPLARMMGQPRPFQTVVHLGRQMAVALSVAHAAGIVHSDIKPENIMVRGDGYLKVLDFGVARLLTPRGRIAPPDSGVDGASVAGTPRYMAPEQSRGEPATSKSDVFAMGAVLYELATGVHPFDGDSLPVVRPVVATREPAAPLPVAADVDPRLARLTARMLASTAEARPSAADVAAELAAMAEREVGVNADTRALPGRRATTRRRWSAIAGLMFVMILVASAILVPRFWSRPIESVAILPFVNVAADPQIDYLCDGVTESVIARLAEIQPAKLKVVALGVVRRFGGKEVDVAALARELHVQAVVLGRIVQTGDTIIVSVELVDTKDRSVLWGDKYETTVKSIPPIQQEIAARISAGLRVRLTGEERQRLARRSTDNPEAYQLYLKGRYHWYRFTPEDYQKSLRFYEQAIAVDPAYARAYAGLARVHCMMAYEGQLPPAEAHPKCAAAAQKAAELDDTVAEVHHALAEYSISVWKWAEAEQHFRRAIDLAPADSHGHRFYGHFLRAMGRWDEAIAEMTRAVALNPESVETTKALGATYLWAGQPHLAIEKFREALDLDPNHAQSHDLLADAYAATGRYREALAARRAYLTLEGATVDADALGADDSAAGYHRAMAAMYRRSLAGLKAIAKDEYVSPVAFVIAHAALGERDQAFRWLETAYDQRAPWLASLKVDPAFASLRSDPRFVNLVARVGLAE